MPYLTDPHGLGSKTEIAGFKGCMLRAESGSLSRSGARLLPHLQHLSKDDMLSVEMRRGAHCDEEPA